MIREEKLKRLNKERTKVWQQIVQDNKLDDDLIANLINIEAELFSTINYGRKDRLLEEAKKLKSEHGINAAIKHLEKNKWALEVGIDNLRKSLHLRKGNIKKEHEEIIEGQSRGIIICDKIIKFLKSK